MRMDLAITYYCLQAPSNLSKIGVRTFRLQVGFRAGGVSEP